MHWLFVVSDLNELLVLRHRYFALPADRPVLALYLRQDWVGGQQDAPLAAAGTAASLRV